MAIEFSGTAPTTFHAREYDGDVDALNEWLRQFNTGVRVDIYPSGKVKVYYPRLNQNSAQSYLLRNGEFIVVTAFDVHIVTREHLQAFGINIPSVATV